METGSLDRILGKEGIVSWSLGNMRWNDEKDFSLRAQRLSTGRNNDIYQNGSSTSSELMNQQKSE